jgi:rod shape-determining protein MreD
VQVVKIVIAIILFLALQSLLPNYIPRFASGVLPKIDITLILTVYLSLKRNPLQGTIVGATTGYSQDLISGVSLLGAGSFTKTIIGFTVSTINVRFAIDNKLTRLFILVGASIVNVLLFLGLHYVFNSVPQDLHAPEIVKLTAWQAAGNLIIGFFLFPILDRIFVQDSYLANGRSSNW